MTSTLLRVLPFVTALSMVALAGGCSESHMGDEVDSGGGPRDTGMSSPDGTVIRPDTGVAPGTDGGPIITPVDSGTTDAGPPDPDTDAGGSMTVDAGPAGVTCGTDTCVDPQICCVNFGGGMMATMTCTAPADCMGVAAACDGPEDCASTEACCGMRGAGGGGGTTSCVADAMCTYGRLCHVDGDCTGTDTCCAFMGAHVCSPFCI